MLREFIFRGRGAATGLLVVAVLPSLLGSFALADRVLIYGIAAASLSLLWGQAGLMSFGQGILFGAGAYASGLAVLDWHVHLIGGLVLGAIAGVVLAAVLGAIATRRSGIYFVLLTFAFAEMFSFLIYAFSNITGGENGLLNVPPMSLIVAGKTFFRTTSSTHLYILCAVLFLLCVGLLATVSDSRYGSVLRAIRDNEKRCEFIGYNTKIFKVSVFALCGGLTAVAGVLYTIQLQSVPPSAMQVPMSENILVMAILGGRRLWGSTAGAFAVVVLSDVVSSFWARWPIILGLALIATVVVKKEMADRPRVPMLNFPNALRSLWVRSGIRRG